MNKTTNRSKVVEKVILKTELVASFDCAIYQNTINIATALAQAGRFVNITTNGAGYTVHIYQRTP